MEATRQRRRRPGVFLVASSAPSTGNVDANDAATEDASNGRINAGIIAVRQNYKPPYQPRRPPARNVTLVAEKTALVTRKRGAGGPICTLWSVEIGY
jgi:hypothetical protein